MSLYGQRPWLSLYDEGMPSDINLDFANCVDMFEAGRERAPDRPLVHYFGNAITVSEVDRLTDALAVGLRDLGIGVGDRVAVYLQNIPQFLLAQLSIWKAGAIMVSVNPMLKEKELELMLTDSGASALVCLESLYGQVAAGVVGKTDVKAVITTSELDLAGDTSSALLAGVKRERHEGTHDLLELIRRHEGGRPEPVQLDSDTVAVLTYTSGTTGPPKGAMNTHGNMVFNAQTYRDWMYLDDDDVVLAVAPLFHVTGLIGHVAVAMLVPMPMVLTYRFDAATVLEAIERHRATFTVGSITVFIALMNDPAAKEHDVSSLTKVYSGGAPIAPPTVEAFEEQFGAYIHNIYGLTETTSPSHAVPFHRRAPVDPNSGALSVGVPVFNTIVKVVGEDGKEVPAGEIGEFVTIGPEVVPGYWQKPEETEHAIPGGELHTGDVGFMDEEGWFYVVDRKKDMINVSGYKVWPRDVEDALYGHPAVREAAVVGVPDPYRGETVKAYVSLKAGHTVEEAELIAFCKERMAAYKYPRQIELIDELPKTVTGKILRRELRDQAIKEQERQ
ncbi:MAG: AMP-binding protein [Actinomycetota bacterium]|nr:AMP-binding protein [Actinomycetota bacterium]